MLCDLCSILSLNKSSYSRFGAFVSYDLGLQKTSSGDAESVVTG